MAQMQRVTGKEHVILLTSQTWIENGFNIHRIQLFPSSSFLKSYCIIYDLIYTVSGLQVWIPFVKVLPVSLHPSAACLHSCLRRNFEGSWTMRLLHQFNQEATWFQRARRRRAPIPIVDGGARLAVMVRRGGLLARTIKSRCG